MPHARLILLPGLDATGALFEPLRRVIPEAWDVRVVSYPTHAILSGAPLQAHLAEQIPPEGPIVLVAESYSGAVALRYAADHAERVRAVVLCASFVTAPVPSCVRWLARPMLFRCPIPDVAIRGLLVGWGASDDLVRQVRSAIRRVRPDVMADRLRQIFDVDATEDLNHCAAPLLYLRAESDRLVGPDAVRPFEKRHHTTIRSLPGPHLLLQAEPVAAWDRIAIFLAEIGIAPAAKTTDDGELAEKVAT